jgi:hypothetical protein
MIICKSNISAFAQVSAKYERAQKHIDDLIECLLAFQKANPYAIGKRDDSQPGQATFYVSSVPEMPAEVSLIFSDALQIAVVHQLI